MKKKGEGLKRKKKINVANFCHGKLDLHSPYFFQRSFVNSTKNTQDLCRKFLRNIFPTWIIQIKNSLSGMGCIYLTNHNKPNETFGNIWMTRILSVPADYS